MTIVSTPDTRNAAWAEDKSSFGRKMLAKMGWSEGQGLGRDKHGSTTHLRAVRRSEDTLGIGAITDGDGSSGWAASRDSYHSVLASLQATHGGSGSGSNSSSSSSSENGDDEERRQREKKRRKRERKMAKKEKNKRKSRRKDGHVGEEENEGGSSSSTTTTAGLTLAQNKVTAGHAAKMRNAKDLSTKSHEDMAAIFGVKVSEYRRSSTSTTVTYRPAGASSPTVVVKNSRTVSSMSRKGGSLSPDSRGVFEEVEEPSVPRREGERSKKEKQKGEASSKGIGVKDSFSGDSEREEKKKRSKKKKRKRDD